MTDDEKLGYIKSQFNTYISNIKTLADFKTFLNSITRAKVIAALKTRVQKEIDIHSGYAVDEQARVDELMVFKNDLDNL